MANFRRSLEGDFGASFAGANRQRHFPPKLHREFHHQTSLRGSGLWQALKLHTIREKKSRYCCIQQTGVYPCALGASCARPTAKKGAPDTENPSCIGFTVLGRGLRPWSQTTVSEGARPWGRGIDPSLLIHTLPFFWGGGASL